MGSFNRILPYSDRQVWANGTDPDQSDKNLHCLLFFLHPFAIKRSASF